MSKFPFNDSVWGNDQNCNLNLTLMGNKERDVIEMEPEASCSSLVSDARKSNSIVRIRGDLNAKNEIGIANAFGGREGRFNLKGKGIMHLRPRTGTRRRRKGAFDCGKHSSAASYDPSVGEAQDGDLHSPPSINKGGNELVEDDKVLQHYGRDTHNFNYTEETPPIMKLGQRSSKIFELREFAVEHDEQHGELEDNIRSGLDLSSEDKNTIRLLEQALEEEHAACNALYLELEKERSAAASAADEAMAMIQRLQEEKASIEMEARQYQRMIEEKSAYDAEEMNILREIIIRRETEKHFLEKEVEAYRQSSNLGNENSSRDGMDMLDRLQPHFDYSFDPNDDPVLMLHQLSAKIDKVTIETKTPDEVIASGKGKGVLAFQQELLSQKSFAVENQGHPVGHLSKISGTGNDDCQDFQDKLVSMDSNSCPPGGDSQSSESFYQSCTTGNSQEVLQEEITILLGNGGEYYEDMNIPAEMAKNNVETSSTQYDNVILKQNENDSDIGPQRSCNMLGKESHVHDVHVVVDQAKLCNQDKGTELDRVSVNRSSRISLRNYVPSESPAVQRVGTTSNSQSASSSNAEVDFGRTNSDITSRLPPLCPKGKSLSSDLRRNSWSDIDNERLKIDYEVGWLQERLRVVQEGREKLNLSVEHREKENKQLKLLEYIANQLQEIRKLTESGKAVRQSSLPPPSSKVISKKRRSRSVSSTLQSS